MGRERIHNPEKLQIGEKMELTGKIKKYSWQYLYTFNNRGAARFKHVKEGNKIFIERIK